MTPRGKPKIWLERDEYGSLPNLTPEKLEALTGKAKNYVIWLLSKTDHTNDQIRKKLTIKNCPDSVIEAIISEMEAQGYLDDLRYAQRIASQEQQRHSGRRATTMKLRSKGIDSETIENAYALLDEEEDETSEEDHIRKLLESKLANASRLGYDVAQRRLVGFLVRRGHPVSLAYQLVNEGLAEQGISR